MFCGECGEIIPPGPMDLRFCALHTQTAARRTTPGLASRLLSWVCRMSRKANLTFA